MREEWGELEALLRHEAEDDLEVALHRVGLAAGGVLADGQAPLVCSLHGDAAVAPEVRAVEERGDVGLAGAARGAEEDELAERAGSGPLVAAVVEGYRVIEGIRTLIGATDPTLAAPGSIRGDLAADTGEKVQRNLVHASDSTDSAAREIGLWFPGLA